MKMGPKGQVENIVGLLKSQKPVEIIQSILAGVLAFGFLMFPSKAYPALVIGNISSIGDSTHMEFKGRNRWNYSLKRVSPDKIELQLPAFSDETEMEFLKWSKGFVRHIKVEKKGADGTYKLTFYLSSTDVESFDYLTDQPSRLIIDLYKRVTPISEVSQTPEIEKKPLPMDSLKKRTPATKKPDKTVEEKLARAQGYEKLKRRPAGTELLEVEGKKEKIDPKLSKTPQYGLFDGGDPDYSRFRIKDYEVSEESVIASRQNIYIRYPMVEIEFKRLQDLLDHPPKYLIRPQDDLENKEARFLISLYKKNRFGAYLKTHKYFMKKYPDSKYKQLIRYLTADLYYKLYKRDKRPVDLKTAKNMYEGLLIDYKKSVLSERTELLLAYMALDDKDGLATVQKFQQYLATHPNSEEKDRARFALAQGYRIMRKPAAALKVYKQIIKNPQNPESESEAYFRIGDIYFDTKQMDDAVDAYRKAVKLFPKYERVYPNAYYNLGEANFWQGKYRKALNDHIRFLELFPNHKKGGYSLTRIGELLDILGADKAKVMGAYLESYFRYRSTQGAEIARVRLLSQRLHSMKEVEVRKSLEEMAQFSKDSTLPKMAEFVTLMVADGLHGRGEYKRALSYLIPYFQSHPTSKNLSFFKRRILRNISDVLRKDVEAQKYMDVLAFYGKNAQTWLRKSDRIDIPFHVAQAYEMAGIKQDSFNSYKTVLKRLKQIKGTPEEKERKVNEHLPSQESVLLRLAAVSLEARKYHRSYNYISAIKNTKDLRLKEKVELVEISARVYEEKGQLAKAKSYLKDLTKSWEGEPSLLMGVHLKLAELHKKTKTYSKSEVSIGFIEEIHRDNPGLNPHVWARTLRLKGDVLLALGRDVAAVDVYLRLLKEFEQKHSLAPVRYRAGLVLFNRGDLKGAEKIWSGLEGKRDEVYFRLAQEKLSNAKWKDDYRRYIDRIPAAKGL